MTKLLLLLSLFIGGCSVRSPQIPWYRNQPALEAQYATAVEDARMALPDEICRTLPAITSPGDNDSLEWISDAGKQLVLVASMMTCENAQRWPSSEESFKLSAAQGKTAMPWVTLPHDLSRHIEAFHCTDSLELQMRMLQLLGLPPSGKYDYIVFFYADPQGIFRPTPDREIHDREAALHFPPDTPPEYRTWFEAYSQIAYKSATPYPWTRLGYTYDWNPASKNHIGPAEFIVNTGSRVRVKEKLPVWHWYQRLLSEQ